LRPLADVVPALVGHGRAEEIASIFVRDGEPGKNDPDTDGAAPATVPAPTVVVTGAAGWLGQNLVRSLAGQANRRRIRCLVHEPSDASPLEVVDPGSSRGR